MILAIESSCDDSAISLFDRDTGILGAWTHSQLEMHAAYGGVVPDLSSREHLNNFPVLLDLLAKEHPEASIDTIAVTHGPGLAPCLAVGLTFAQALGLALGAKLVGVNHLKGHAFSPFIQTFEASPKDFKDRFRSLLPHLGLIVSGGNTILFEIDEALKIRILGQTVDDAAGEALDKGAKLLGMPYPGGPLIEKRAQGGDAKAYDFPRALRTKNDARFSFSGLKTSLRYTLENISDADFEGALPHLCASYQEAVIEQLRYKTEKFLERGSFKSLGLSGGVANNKVLQARFSKLAGAYQAEPLIALPQHTSDNAAMIAFAAHIYPEGTVNEEALSIQPALPLA